MFRAVAIIAVMLFGTLLGCRCAPRAPLAARPGTNDPRSADRTSARTSETTSGPMVRPAAYVQEMSDIDRMGFELKQAGQRPSATTGAEPATSLTLADLVDVALQNNPTLAAATARMEAARGRKLQAGLFPNPVAGYHATEMGNVGTVGQQGAFISQRIITGGKLRLDQAIAGKEVDTAHYQFHAQQQRVLNDVRVRFYEAMVAQRQVELTDELARIGDELVAATQKLTEGRLGTEVDLLQAEIRADESRILLDNARNQQLESWRRLVAAAGVPDMLVTALTGALDSDLPALDWDRCETFVLDGNYELHAARQRAERARIVLRRAQKEPLPNVDLMVSVRHHNVTRSDVANVQVGIPIPIFDKNQGNIRAAEAEWAFACQEVRRIELDLRDRLAVAFRRYANARQQVDRYGERIVPRAKRSLQLVTDGYQSGQVEYLSLLTAQQTYLQASLSYLDALRELWSAASIIESQLLTDSLAFRFSVPASG